MDAQTLPSPYESAKSSFLISLGFTRGQRRARGLARVAGYLRNLKYIDEPTQAPGEYARLRYTGPAPAGRAGWCILFKNGSVYHEGRQALTFFEVIAQIGGQR